MGGGDIKLLFVAGLYFGWTRTLFLILVACVAGIVFGMARASDEERAFPFGPAIALACWVTMLVGDGVVSWYLSLFL
jgi:leader peptidase (prepilin peptidase)/N-methyltransferase